MREYSTPPTMELADVRQPDRRRRRQRPRPRRPTWSSAARDGADGWGGVTAAAVPRRGAGGGQGAGRGRHRARRPGRAHLQDPLRVDAARLRDLVRGRRDGAGLRDVVGRAGRVDPRRTPARARSSRRPPSTSPGSPRSAARLDRAQPRLVDHRQRGRHPDPARAGHHRRGARAAAYGGGPGRPRHADLHLGHHRPAQGLHAHPRQLHGRARRGRRRAARAVRHRGRLDAALPAAGARLRADHPGRRASSRGPGSGTARDIKNLRRGPPGVPADVRARRAAGLREGVQHRLAAGHRRRPRRRLRPGRRDRDRLLARPRQGQAVARASAPSTRCSRGSSTAGSATRSAAAASSPSPAARRSASGSATSTAASGSPSSRATA